MILSDRDIVKRTGLIDPFFTRTVHEGMTFGLGPAGYDVRVAENFDLPIGAFTLASTVERFVLPDDLVMRIHDKSTWARRGLFVQNTIAEPGWAGYLTLELTNNGHEDIRVTSGMPIAQVMFELLLTPTLSPYRGKYQNQASRPQPAISEPGEQ